jgi:hypothetical protein
LPLPSAYADHPVTIVKLSGERMTGQFADLHNNQVYLRVDQNREPRIPLSDIAVIEFTNARIAEPESEGLQSRQGEHLLVLRNGRRIEGRFEGITGDDQPHSEGHPLEFVFRATSGDYLRMNADRIARIYLAESRTIDDTTAADNVTVWLEDGSSIRGALTALDSRALAMDRMRAGGVARHALADIAVIDFDGSGRLASDERWTGARDERGPHLLIMKNGRRVPGEFIGPARGSMGRGMGRNPSYLFRAANGRIVSFTPADASRLYLSRTGATSDLTDDQFGNETPLVVSSQEAWTRTNVTVRRGDVLMFRASGDVQLSADDNDRARPGGSLSGRRAPAAPLREASAGALIGRVGSTVFLIGDGQEVRMPASGELWLGINDDHFADNRGTYQVRVRRDRIVSQ